MIEIIAAETFMIKTLCLFIQINTILHLHHMFVVEWESFENLEEVT